MTNKLNNGSAIVDEPNGLRQSIGVRQAQRAYGPHQLAIIPIKGLITYYGPQRNYIRISN